MPEKTEEEKLREELLRKAQEEQERYAAEEEERRLTEESRRQYEETKRILAEHVDFTKRAFEDMGKFREEMSKRISDMEQRRFMEEWERAFQRWGNMASGALRDVMQRSMARSIDSSTVGQLTPGLGETGRQMGTMLGEYIGSAFGPVGTVIGRAIGGPIVDMISMQAEGYNMLGARVARQAYGGGRGIGQDFEKIGQDYREMVNQVVRETGMTAEAVGAAFDALSKVNIGFEEGGKDLAQFALSADRVLNLRPGRTLQMETDLVTKYGESARQAKTLTRDLIDAMAMFNVESSRTGNSFMAAFASGETLANTLEQISSAARSSGASLDALNGMAIMFVTTISQSGMLRPGEESQAGARVLSGLMPKSSGTPAAEAKRSEWDLKMVQQTDFGRRLADRILKEGDAFGMSPKNRELMFDSLASMHFSRQGIGRRESYQWLAATLKGSKEIAGGNQMKQWKLLEERGFQGTDILAAQKLTDDFDRAGVFTSKHPEKIMRQIMDQKAKDPEYAETIKHMRKFMDEAKKQGDAQASTLDKISDHMTKMSVWFNRSYWTHGRDAIAEAFGLAPKASMAALAQATVLDPMAGPAGLQRWAGNVGRLLHIPGMGGASRPEVSSGSSGGALSRTETTISGDSHARLVDNATANRAGLETTGQ